VSTGTGSANSTNSWAARNLTTEAATMSNVCRVCQSRDGQEWLAFGPQPNSVRLLTGPEETAATHPLTLACCPACGFIYIDDPMPAEAFYGEAQQVTSSFPARHLPWLVQQVASRLDGKAGALVYEIGCNDGYFLRLLREAGIPGVAGIEPAPGCAAQARAAGLQVETGYFSRSLAARCVAAGPRPQVLVCRHVLEHILDLDDFVAGMDLLLAPGGELFLEVPDLASMEQQGDVSAIWEQHVNYFDLPVLEKLFARHGFRVAAAHCLPHGGGTLLAVLQRGEPAAAQGPPADREGLRAALGATLRSLRETLGRLRGEGKRIMGFGAGMRGTLLINLSGIGPDLECVLDDNPDKCGRFLPGSRLPVLHPRLLVERPPDVCLVLPLNSKEAEQAVMARFQAFEAGGGRFLEYLPVQGGILLERRSSGSPERLAQAREAVAGPTEAAIARLGDLP